MKHHVLETAITAMCAWEHIFRLIRNYSPLGGKWFRLGRSIGTPTLRELVALMSPRIEEAYNIAFENGFDGPYDDEFIPWILNEMTDGFCSLAEPEELAEWARTRFVNGEST